MTTQKPVDSAVSQARILIVDDHPIIRQGVARLIESQPDMTVCCEAADARQALKCIEKVDPDLAIIDLSLDKDLSGVDLLKDINLRFPYVSTLVLSMHSESVFAERVLRAGAKGYVMKEEAPETILTAIRRVLEGKVYLSDGMSTKMLTSFAGRNSPAEKLGAESLSDRELEILNLIGRGLGPSLIAEKLCLSVKTIETHRTHIKQKLQIQSSCKLLQYAIEWVKAEGSV